MEPTRAPLPFFRDPLGVIEEIGSEHRVTIEENTRAYPKLTRGMPGRSPASGGIPGEGCGSRSGSAGGPWPLPVPAVRPELHVGELLVPGVP